MRLRVRRARRARRVHLHLLLLPILLRRRRRRHRKLFFDDVCTFRSSVQPVLVYPHSLMFYALTLELLHGTQIKLN